MRREVVPQGRRLLRLPEEPERFNHVYGAGSASIASSSHERPAKTFIHMILAKGSKHAVDENDGVTEHSNGLQCGNEASAQGESGARWTKVEEVR